MKTLFVFYRTSDGDALSIAFLLIGIVSEHLRRGILSGAFIRRVFYHGPDGADSADAVVPRHLFGFVDSYAKFRGAVSEGAPPPPAISLAHPYTPAAARLFAHHLAPFFSWGGGGGADLLACFYDTLTSRDGLVVLRRRYPRMSRETGVCVYDPMTGATSFFPDPMDEEYSGFGDTMTYVLLTPSDYGVGCAFLLLMADFTGFADPAPGCSSIMIQTVSSSDAAAAGGRGEWRPATTAPCRGSHRSKLLHPSAVVVGSSIHWVMFGGTGRAQRDYLHVLTYNVCTRVAGLIELPMDRLPESYTTSGDANLRLASTTDGSLAMLCREGLKISVWRLSVSDDAGWAPHAVINTETPLLSLLPGMPQPCRILFECLGERSRVLLFTVKGRGFQGLVVLDIETQEMHKVDAEIIHIQAIPFEVDLESRFLRMKTFH
ncbi:hypothetical protein BS78_K058600 [Paspalum vaginatum]|uniref:DUF7595 domain-containing protein n=1 Tax=Paspalum vaginatum TaxID=158149 RepID=A0A9W8CCT2_9POAL|nr:hypothetical protein BS78_K058600 [Paspalum vaginatum]